MKIGIDSYSYHRLLGEIRPGEIQPDVCFANGTLDVIAEAKRLNVHGVSLETCFLGNPGNLDTEGILAASKPLDIMLAWGHPHGLAFGTDQDAFDDLVQWLRIAQQLQCSLVRIVVASPKFRGMEPIDMQIGRTIPWLRKACAWAKDYDLELAIENHGDLNSREIIQLLEEIDEPILGVCLDTVNLVRVGDEPLIATDRLAPFIKAVHLKDCEDKSNYNPITGPRAVGYGKGIIPVAKILSILETKTTIAFRKNGLVCVEIGHIGPGILDERKLVEECVEWLQVRISELMISPA